MCSSTLLLWECYSHVYPCNRMSGIGTFATAELCKWYARSALLNASPDNLAVATYSGTQMSEFVVWIVFSQSQELILLQLRKCFSESCLKLYTLWKDIEKNVCSYVTQQCELALEAGLKHLHKFYWWLWCPLTPLYLALPLTQSNNRYPRLDTGACVACFLYDGSCHKCIP